jgi:REP element-mobilizing transposase RayT
MPDACTHIYIHLVWATYDREPLLTGEYENAIHPCIAEKCREAGCVPLAIGGMPDHIHALVRLSSTVSTAQLVKSMKGASSHLMTHSICPSHGFRWQASYGAFSITESHVSRVAEYIQRQKEHHAKGDLWPMLERCSEERAEARFAMPDPDFNPGQTDAE